MKRKLLSKRAKTRAEGLLDMLYTPQELAEELLIDRQKVYSDLLPAGMPHTQDESGLVWLHGLTVAAWIKTIDQRYEVHVPEGHTYCVHCKAAVKLVRATRMPHGKVDLLQAECPQCGSRINRFVRRERRD